MLTTLSQLQMLADEDEAALETVYKIRALEDKPDAKLWSGAVNEAWLKARLATRRQCDEALQASFKREYAAIIGNLP